MRSAIITEPGGPEVIHVEHRDRPDPGPGEVRIQVAYAALNPLDNHARANRIQWMHPGFPFTPGFEYAGRVDAVGQDVERGMVGSGWL